MTKEDLEKVFRLFSQYGIKSITMDDISSALGVSKKTLYIHYSNKEELVAACAREDLLSSNKEVQDIVLSSTDAVEEMWRIALHVVKYLSNISPSMIFDLKKYFGSVWNEYHQEKNLFIYEIILQNITKGKRSGLYRSAVDEDLIAKIFISRSDFCVDDNLFPSDKYEKKQLFEHYIEYHIRGISTPKGTELLELYKQVLQS